MKIMFHAWGHRNISAEHKTTIEFTKDEEVTPSGDCIVGVAADFDAVRLREFVKRYPRMKVTMRTGALSEVVHARVNPDFDDDHEIVIRMGAHASPRTFGVRADKAAAHFDREFVRALKTGSPMEVDIEEAVE